MSGDFGFKIRKLVSQRHQKVSGGNSGGATPDPIPNSEVKPSRANGTAGGTLWESRSSPGNNLKAGRTQFSRPFLFLGSVEHRQLLAEAVGDEVLEAIAGAGDAAPLALHLAAGDLLLLELAQVLLEASEAVLAQCGRPVDVAQPVGVLRLGAAEDGDTLGLL